MIAWRKLQSESGQWLQSLSCSVICRPHHLPPDNPKEKRG